MSADTHGHNDLQIGTEIESKPVEVKEENEANDNEQPRRAWDIFDLEARLLLKDPMEKAKLLEKYSTLCCGKRAVAKLDHFFNISARDSSFVTEWYAGTTTFFSLAYIMVLNPFIVASAIGMQYKAGLFFSTCFASGIFTILMGLLVNLPVALAPGMGLNAYFANVSRVVGTTLVGALTWQQAMASVFLSGILYLFFTITGLRFLLFKAVPSDLRHAMSAGIGLFICIIGYKIGWIMGVNYYGPPLSTKGVVPFFFYDIMQVNLTESREACITVVGLMWVAFFLTIKVRAGILCAIIMTTFCGIVGNGMGKDSVTQLGVWKQDPIPFVADTSNLLSGHMDFSAISHSKFWDVTWTFLFVEMFDSFGTLSTVVMKSGIAKRGDVKQVDRLVNNAMLVDGWGLLFGSLIGSNSITCFIESLTGIGAGGRTGFTSLITGSYFLLSLLFVYPFVAIIPDSATVPALFMVGVYSISSIKEIDWDDFPIAFSAFMMIATMPFTYSIANGIAASFVFYNFCVIVRWLSFRLTPLRTAPNMPAPAGEGKQVWDIGWNPVNDKDFLPHWVMVAFGMFMCFRYRYFF